MLSREAVVWAYRYVLGREPEDDQVVDRHLHHADWEALRKAFMESMEFKSQLRTSSSSGRHAFAPPIRIDLRGSASDLATMFQHVGASWVHLGESEPHWSVITAEQYKSARIGDTENAFYASGKVDAALIKAFFERNNQSLEHLKSCLEFGCGVGRATSAIAGLVPHVFAIDVSAPHLRLARAWLEKNGISNVTLVQLTKLEDVTKLPEFDLIYSTIVFQHNPPPVMLYLLETLFSKLARGGYALFQVPTYRAGYEFVWDEYLNGRTPGMEMHVLPQSVIFDLFRRHEMDVIEVQEDGLTGSDSFLSHTFFAKRRESRS